MIGRPYVFALATAGAAGVARCVTLLRDEFETAMALTGRRNIGEIDRIGHLVERGRAEPVPEALALIGASGLAFYPPD